MLPVLVTGSDRRATDRESVALVRPAQPIVCPAAIREAANGEVFTIDVQGEQHGSGPTVSGVVDARKCMPATVAAIPIAHHASSIGGSRPSRP